MHDPMLLQECVKDERVRMSQVYDLEPEKGEMNFEELNVIFMSPGLFNLPQYS